MQSLVVFLALAAVASGSLEPLAQPAHLSGIVLDPFGRPLDTADVTGARALHLQAKALEYGYLNPFAHSLVTPAVVAPTVIAAPTAVSHQSRVDVKSSPTIVEETVAAPVLTRTVAAPVFTAPLVAHAIAPSAVSHQSRVDVKSSPAVISESVEAAPLATPWVTSSYLPISPVWGAKSALASPLLVRSGPLGHAHFIKKRSLGHWGYATPFVAPSAVSHQSRVDVQSTPTIVEEAVAAPVLTRTIAAPVFTAPLVAHTIAPSAVSHQSRVDVKSSPTIVEETVAAPVLTRTVAASVFTAPLVAHAIAPSAVSHQSRVDVKSSPAVISESVVAAPLATPWAASSYLPISPVWGAESALASPHLVRSGPFGHAHFIKKRSLGHWGYATPFVAPSAVSHQSRVDVQSNPTIVEETVGTPVLTRTVAAPVFTAPIVAHAIAPSAVSHQSRVDVKSSPTIVEETVAAPVLTRTVAAPVFTAPLAAHAIAPSAISHQSRVDVTSSPAVITKNYLASPLVHTGAIATPFYGPGLFGW